MNIQDVLAQLQAFWGGSVAAAGILMVTVALAAALHYLWIPLLFRMTRRTKTRMDDLIIRSLRFPVVIAVLGLGTYFALDTIPRLDGNMPQIRAGFVILATMLAALQAVSLMQAMISWYAKAVAGKTRTDLDDKLLPVMRRASTVIIIAIASLIILDRLGINISPLLAGLGIGGIAVALAIQPTLGNFLAGTYVLADTGIRIGDYVQLQGGPEGYVEQVGWRSTKIRTWFHTLVVVPNSQFADTIVTNHSAPTPEMNVIITGGVSYNSDLDRVEEITVEVAKEIVNRSPNSAKGFEPWFGFDKFAESNVTFWVFVQARDRISSFALTTQLIKALHRRFREEGIELMIPARKMYFAEEQLPIRIAEMTGLTK